MVRDVFFFSFLEDGFCIWNLLLRNYFLYSSNYFFVVTFAKLFSLKLNVRTFDLSLFLV